MPRSTATQRQTVRDFGTCLQHTGVNGSYARLTSLTGAVAANVTQSISLWINIREKKSTTILSYENSGSSSQIGIAISTTTFVISKWGGASLISTALPTLNQWHHVVYTYNSVGTVSSLYIDAVAITPTTNAPQTAVPTNLELFDYSGHNQAFNGFIDDVRVYNRLLSSAEVTNLFYGIEPDTANFNLHWKLDEGSGTAMVDSRGIQSNGTIAGATYSTNVVMKTRTVAARSVAATRSVA